MLRSKISTLVFVLVVAQSKMLYISELFRHGARYPTHDIFDGKDTKAFRGQLTSIGMRQQYLLGSYLKRDYIDQLKFLNPTFDPKEVEIFSDGQERCDESAYAHAAGLFQLDNGAVIPPEVDRQFLQPPFQLLAPNLQEDSDFSLDRGYQPIPIKPDETHYFPPCPKEAQLLIKRGEVVVATVLQFQAEQTPFIERMTKIFNLTISESNLYGMADLYDTVVCDLYLGRALPSSFNDHDFQQLKYIQNYIMILLFGGEYSKVKSTPLATPIISKMQQVIAGQFSSKKISIYSGHDSNVAPMLSFFNISSPECVKKKFRNQTVTGNCGQPVPFASSLIFELHQRDNQLPSAGTYYVRIRYNGDYYKLCDSTATECAFQEFKARVTHQLKDYNKECGVK